MSRSRKNQPPDEQNNENLVLQKGLPSNIDAEKFILGSILLDDKRFVEVAGVVNNSHFTTEAHRRIFTRMQELYDRGEKIDRVTVANELQRWGELESVGGLTYVISLDDGLPQISNLDSYVRIVRDKAMLRKIAVAAQQLQNRAILGEDNPHDILMGAEETLVGLSLDQPRRGLMTPLEIVSSFEGGINAFLDPSKRAKGLSTGFTKFDEMTGGLHDGELIIIAARPSMGKAQPVDAPVKTLTGWKSIGSLAIGDDLASRDGGESIVTGVFPQGQKQIYRILFSDGRSAEACTDHLWEVQFRKWHEPKVMTTAEVADLIKQRQYRKRLSIPLINGCFGSDEMLPMKPWLLGYALGNGCFCRGAGITISVPDAETVARLNDELAVFECLLKKTDNVGGIDYRIINTFSDKCDWRRNNFTSAIRSLGLFNSHAHHKFIPPQYFESSPHSRAELLRGLMDSDGTAEKSAACTFTSCSEQLALDVQRLVRSLGGISSIRSRIPSFTYKGEKKQGRRAFTLGVSFPFNADVFWLRRKLDRSRSRRSKRRSRLSFVSIEPVRVDEAMCISVSHPSQTYITNDFIVTHNTAFAMNVAWHVAHNLEKQVAVFSLEMSNESLMNRMMCSAARVDSQRFRAGYLNAMERDKLRSAMGNLVEAPLHIDDSAGLTLMDMHAKLRKLQSGGQQKLGLVIVDYLQLMSGGKFENRQQEVSYLSRGMKLLAKEMRCPFMVLSQLSRATETRTGDHRPIMSDLRESGSLEQDSDVIGFIFREEVYKRDREDLRGMAELIIAKQRSGPTGKIDLVFLHAMTKFENRAEDLGDPPQEVS